MLKFFVLALLNSKDTITKYTLPYTVIFITGSQTEVEGKTKSKAIFSRISFSGGRTQVSISHIKNIINQNLSTAATNALEHRAIKSIVQTNFAAIGKVL